MNALPELICAVAKKHSRAGMLAYGLRIDLTPGYNMSQLRAPSLMRQLGSEWYTTAHHLAPFTP